MESCWQMHGPDGPCGPDTERKVTSRRQVIAEPRLRKTISAILRMMFSATASEQLQHQMCCSQYYFFPRFRTGGGDVRAVVLMDGLKT